MAHGFNNLLGIDPCLTLLGYSKEAVTSKKVHFLQPRDGPVPTGNRQRYQKTNPWQLVVGI